jgi:hypothetical protein
MPSRDPTATDLLRLSREKDDVDDEDAAFERQEACADERAGRRRSRNATGGASVSTTGFVWILSEDSEPPAVSEFLHDTCDPAGSWNSCDPA